ncbi:Shedu immune nuclease family protein [Paenibacillus antarcticus]|uniref:Shedu protein SduA C-terminal domain-containing protein n=1 Tax=Paenibacillus antarcticus TaxID=253703 RepID=A0A162K324_9BACL|nr:Shedu immune nuclease family protein [Paenibacillus antarcticus]OAB42336.1 hypothetical protein PBAT_20265 [Paenibacillus antarcticus]
MNTETLSEIPAKQNILLWMVTVLKVSDFIFRYPINYRNDAICRTRIFINSKGEAIVILTDLGTENPSFSVTNSIEYIYSSLIDKGLIPKGSIIVEHYENDDINRHEFDLVTFDQNGHPDWSSIQLDKLIKILECDQNEICEMTLTVTRLVSEIEKIKYEMNPQDDFLYRESPEVIKRRLDIESRMINKESIFNLIQKGTKELDILKLLKTDLSVFGEVYANPKEEYICFSEFPVSDGFVDFVLFTGRSRMDVYLIEVKGANFNLVNQGGYESFSRKIEEAAGQLRRRLGDIYDDYEGFRKEVHKVRSKVESGHTLYNSFMGPEGHLEVDPNKKISIYTVLIAGRTVDDLKESRKRHEYEVSFTPSIKLESWDTFLRKLKRK